VYATPGNYAIVASATNEDGTFSVAGPTVSVTPKVVDYLVVQSFAPTPSGFKIRFNHAFDPTSLNLTSAADQPMGGPDVSLVGSKVGKISGSIVLDSDLQGFTFLQTGSLQSSFIFNSDSVGLL